MQAIEAVVPRIRGIKQEDKPGVRRLVEVLRSKLDIVEKPKNANCDTLSRSKWRQKVRHSRPIIIERCRKRLDAFAAKWLQ